MYIEIHLGPFIFSIKRYRKVQTVTKRYKYVVTKTCNRVQKVQNVTMTIELDAKLPRQNCSLKTIKLFVDRQKFKYFYDSLSCSQFILLKFILSSFKDFQDLFLDHLQIFPSFLENLQEKFNILKSWKTIKLCRV